MSTGDALLRTILERPDDDTARLVYADWFQENGDEARAEFVRVQCRIAHLDMGARMLPKGVDRELLFAVERNLVRNHWDDWVPLKLDGEYLFAWDEAAATIELGCSRSFYTFNRGFVSEICLPLAAFIQDAEALFRAHPIERVTLTDRRPYHNSAGWCWYNRDRKNKTPDVPEAAELPEPLFDKITAQAVYSPGRIALFHTQDKAMTALPVACVAYGRSLAGLSACRVNSHHAAQT